MQAYDHSTQETKQEDQELKASLGNIVSLKPQKANHQP